MSIRAGGAEDMFLDVKDLAVRKVRIRKSYAPGSIDFGTNEVKQAEPLEVTATDGRSNPHRGGAGNQD
jgi:hypothetical protein